MRDAGLRIGVSRSVMVEHRFAGDDFAFAMDQFAMDGFGLGRMIRKHGWRGAPPGRCCRRPPPPVASR